MSSRNIAKEVGSQLMTSARKRKTRGSAMMLNNGGGGGNAMNRIPSLKDFMHKQRVLKQYRDFFRAVRCIPDEDGEWKGQIQNEIRDTFRMRVEESEKLAITMAITDGERKLKELQSMVGYQEKQPNHNNTQTVNDASDSWLNIEDEDDKRGRVGQKWPWD